MGKFPSGKCVYPGIEREMGEKLFDFWGLFEVMGTCQLFGLKLREFLVALNYVWNVMKTGTTLIIDRCQGISVVLALTSFGNSENNAGSKVLPSPKKSILKCLPSSDVIKELHPNFSQ